MERIVLQTLDGRMIEKYVAKMSPEGTEVDLSSIYPGVIHASNSRGIMYGDNLELNSKSSLHPRWMLYASIERLAALGLEVKCSFEQEFYFLARNNPRVNYLTQIDPPMAGLFMDVANEFKEITGNEILSFHKEVGPGQFEVTPVYTDCLRAYGENIILMDLITNTFKEYELTFSSKLSPELPGSGKHLNWSIWKKMDGGILYNVTMEDRYREAILAAIAIYSKVLTTSVYHGSNKNRLISGMEAPSPFMSVHTNTEVRNRTSPIIFMEDRIEFRSIGADQNGALFLGLLNNAVYDMLTRDKLPDSSCWEGIINNGNCYADMPERKIDWELKDCKDLIRWILSDEEIELWSKILK